jgi:flagellar basal-body rod protein FlgF
MDNSAYIALSRQLTLFRDMDVTSNNIANANTTGYSSEHIIFDSYVTKDINQGKTNPMAFANDLSTFRNTETGPLRATGNDLDVAIQGNGYFAVQTPLGIRYTRAGNFQIAADGTLSTADGYAVLDASSQPIVLPEDTNEIRIGEGGNMKVNGDDFATIGVVQFSNPQLLERLSGKMFRSSIPAQPADNVRVAQGMLEGSNVQPVTELTHMMTLSHTVTDTAQFIGVIYDLERKAANAWTQQS